MRLAPHIKYPFTINWTYQGQAPGLALSPLTMYGPKSLSGVSLVPHSEYFYVTLDCYLVIIINIIIVSVINY